MTIQCRLKLFFLLAIIVELVKISAAQQSGAQAQCEYSTHDNIGGFCVIDSGCCKGTYVRGLCNDDDVCCYGRYDCSDTPISANITTGTNSPVITGLCPIIINRANWGAVNPLRKLVNLRVPVERVFVHHTSDGSSCFETSSCNTRVKSLQSYHQRSKKWSDIAWNFLIGGNGQVYEGIGWNREGFHTLNWNSKSLGIAMIGVFDDEYPSVPMTNALEYLINCGVSRGYVSSGYQLHGHRDARSTTCPGNNVYSYISGMPRYQAGPLPGYN